MNNPDRIPHQPAEHADTQLVAAAQRYVQQLQAFYVHAGVFAGGMIIIFLVNLATNARRRHHRRVVGMVVGLGLHRLGLRHRRPRTRRPAEPTGASSSTWEQRQIDKVLAK